MKSMKEIYRLAIKDLSTDYRNPHRKWFICLCFERLKRDEIITEIEYKRIMKHFVSEKPTKRKNYQFYEHKLFNKSPTDLHDVLDIKDQSWWDMQDYSNISLKEVLDQKRLFLNHLINKLR